MSDFVHREFGFDAQRGQATMFFHLVVRTIRIGGRNVTEPLIIRHTMREHRSRGRLEWGVGAFLACLRYVVPICLVQSLGQRRALW